jgi:hypothetical protein
MKFNWTSTELESNATTDDNTALQCKRDTTTGEWVVFIGSMELLLRHHTLGEAERYAEHVYSKRKDRTEDETANNTTRA